MEQKQVASRRSRQEMVQLLNEYEKASGVTVKAFCELHQIKEGAFYSVRKRQRTQNPSKGKLGGFVEIRPAVPEGRTSSLFAEVNGIRIYQTVPAAYLKSLAS